MFKKILLLIMLFYLTAFASYPDTLIIKMTKHKGKGPFHTSFARAHTMSLNNSWNSSTPKITGLPDTLSRFMITVIYADFMQHAYQNYYMGNISMERFMDLEKSWNWHPDSTRYTKDFVKVAIGIAAGINKKNETVVIVDRNNNLDLSDDPPYIIPPKIKEQKYRDRYNEDSLITVKYSYFNGDSVVLDSTWLYIDYDLFTFKTPDSLLINSPVSVFYTYIEYRTGEVVVNGKKWKFAVRNGRPVYRNYTSLKMQTGLNEDGMPQYTEAVNIKEKVKIGDAYYTFKDVLKGGEYIVLTKIGDAEGRISSQVGFYAPQFSGKSYNGEEINFADYRGKYVLLDFWGTWCAPCVAEISHLKKIYEKYADKNFEIIGIAKDKKAKIEKFVKEKNIAWPQIIQDELNEIITLYNVRGYPTTILLDPDGKIIAKNLRSTLLDDKLKEVLGKDP